ncbi:hypothetical protein VPNG_03644 [Cytospora leucostoma]|uniref:Uncharacterized protein n=1 Tax=Cytospora leucostoma TaxID=1230097 RepID=A0A423XCM7_9PEZI|nr:hypothetical protein VPNG_03644 [Cytospora leucostoma]
MAASDPAAYATLPCTGSGSTTGTQTLEAVCYGSSSNTADGANGRLFLASSLTTVASDCPSVTLNVVRYTIDVAIGGASAAHRATRYDG